METYYYDNQSYRGIRELIEAVRHDVDFSLDDHDIDMFFRENGGVIVDGEEFQSCAVLKRHYLQVYREKRDEIVEWVVSGVKDEVEQGFFPLHVPFTYNVIECSE